MENNFVWTDELVEQFAEEYRFSSSRISLEQFKKSKQPKPKDYEILSFKDNYNSIVNWRGEKEHGGYNYKQWVDGCLSFDYKIHSVRRLSDGEVFTVGDKVCWGILDNYEAKITGFKIEDGRLQIEFTDSSWESSVDFEKAYKLHKKSKKVLFTTEDGVEIHDEERYYVVITKEGFGCVPFSVAWCGEGEIESANYKNAAKFFASNEAANDFIVMNKPCLSLNEVYDILDPDKSSLVRSCEEISKMRELEQKVKSKL